MKRTLVSIAAALVAAVLALGLGSTAAGAHLADGKSPTIAPVNATPVA